MNTAADFADGADECNASAVNAEYEPRMIHMNAPLARWNAEFKPQMTQMNAHFDQRIPSSATKSLLPSEAAVAAKICVICEICGRIFLPIHL